MNKKEMEEGLFEEDIMYTYHDFLLSQSMACLQIVTGLKCLYRYAIPLIPVWMTIDQLL